MPARWLLVFSVAASVGHRLPAVLSEVPHVVVASESGPEDDLVVTVEVDADPVVVDDVTRQVRAADPDATRIHDSIIEIPDDDEQPATAAMDFDVTDEPTPCRHCSTWRHELAVADDGSRVLREWHRADCPEYQSWL